MIIEIVVEDELKVVLDQPGNKLAVETAVHKKLFELRDAYYAKLSRQSVMSRGFIGTTKQ